MFFKWKFCPFILYGQNVPPRIERIVITMKKEMTCVACPLGCHLSVEHNNGDILTLTGNACKRGVDYAKTEITNPTRTLTTTVRVDGGILTVVPVKSAQPVPKSLLFDCMKVINKAVLKHPVKLGDIVVKNILNTNVDIITTNNN